MKIETVKDGYNKQRGGYERIVAAGSYRIEKLKRTNVLGHGIMVTGDRGLHTTTFTLDAAKKLIARDAATFAFKQTGDRASVLVVYHVGSKT